MARVAASGMLQLVRVKAQHNWWGIIDLLRSRVAGPTCAGPRIVLVLLNHALAVVSSTNLGGRGHVAGAPYWFVLQNHELKANFDCVVTPSYQLACLADAAGLRFPRNLN